VCMSRTHARLYKDSRNVDGRSTHEVQVLLHDHFRYLGKGGGDSVCSCRSLAGDASFLQ
jgi:hypothetical protein